uniref:NADH-ubiquinone oxidoreductase chain 6 n=1 Tax=Nemotelus notatus TaxID=2719078 RepID=A0A7D7ADM0_9DIPT|nr:NADH dehydrogenase subunit 6 [Nemotelus notatus]
MTQMIVFFLMTISSMMFIQMTHPLAMGLMLLIQSFLTCLITGLMYNSFWYSYVLFLVFLGGMLILFIYVTSLASNEMFSFSLKIMIKSMMLFTILMLMLMIMDTTLISNLFENDNLKSFFNKQNLMPMNSISLMNIYNFPINLISILLMNYLLLTLVVVVKITNLSYGPLRPMN